MWHNAPVILRLADVYPPALSTHSRVRACVLPLLLPLLSLLIVGTLGLHTGSHLDQGLQIWSLVQGIGWTGAHR